VTAVEYIRLYTRLLSHPKAEPLSDRAWRTLTLSWCYAGLHETGGHVPSAARRHVRMTDRVEQELVAAGWLRRNGDGWLIHDWDEHQEDANVLAEIRRRARERKRSERARRRGEQGADVT
jgi:hypothetical protein